MGPKNRISTWARSLGIAASIFSITGCTGVFGSKVVARIGDRKITKSDLEQRQKQQQFENQTTDVPAAVALKQLARAFIGAEILVRAGRPVSDTIINAEAQRIDQSTLMPDRLKQTKALFHSNEDYLRLYVLPVYVNRVLYFDFFLRSAKIHAPILEKAKVFKQRFDANRQDHSSRYWNKLATENGLQARKFEVSPSAIRPITGAKLGPNGPQSMSSENIPANVKARLESSHSASSGDTESAKLIRDVLSHLKPGETSPVLEFQNYYSVMRLDKKKSTNSYIVDSVIFPKRNFEEWFKEEAASIKADCLDQSICKNGLIY